MSVNIEIINDTDGNRIVVIPSRIFTGKKINWELVEIYLKEYVGEIYCIAEDGELVYIGSELPGEYTGSVYTRKLKGANAGAKANAVQGLPEIVEITSNGIYEENMKAKHSRNAQNGWYRYDTRFAVPVFSDNQEVERYNIFKAKLLIRHASSGKNIYMIFWK